MTNRKIPRHTPNNYILYLIITISGCVLLGFIFQLIQEKRIPWELLGIVISILGLVIPVMFFFISWLNETSDKIEKLEREIIKHDAKIEYFGKFTEVNNSLSAIYERQTKIIQKIGVDVNENIQQ